MPPNRIPGLEKVKDQTVLSAIDALSLRDKRGWFGLFADDAEFSDDGLERDLVSWCEEELFGTYHATLLSIDRAEGEGRTFWARYHSDKWGDFQSLWKFQVKDGRITRLDVGATRY